MKKQKITTKYLVDEIDIIKELLENIESNISERVENSLNSKIHTFPVLYEELLNIKSLYFSGSIANENLNSSILEKYTELLQRNNELFDEIIKLKKKLNID